jgi:hypothetical protein
MPSNSYNFWSSTRADSLDEIENAHRSVGGSGPGRRMATQQINQAYAILLSSQFQGFCRDLHAESVDHFVRGVNPPSVVGVLREEFFVHRRLASGNPTPGNLGADFNRLGLDFWVAVLAADARTAQRREQLEELNAWRNAIAHQDFDPGRLGGRTRLQLREVRAWRTACDGLAQTFDGVMRAHIQTLLGIYPW